MTTTFKESIKASIGKPTITPFPCILIVGSSGSGKSRSITSLPPAQTVILNIESKPLTFPNADTFIDSNIQIFHDSSAAQISEWENILKKALEDPTIKYIVIDSFTKWTEILLDWAKSSQKGYDIYNLSNKKVYRFLEAIKWNNKKFVIVIGIDDIVNIDSVNGSRVSKRVCSVKGKEWESKIEKEFSIVLFSDVVNDKGKILYRFTTTKDETNTAKTPEGMFKETSIPNDLKLVCDTCEKYFKLI